MVMTIGLTVRQHRHPSSNAPFVNQVESVLAQHISPLRRLSNRSYQLQKAIKLPNDKAVVADTT